jgi:hypothetical protein
MATMIGYDGPLLWLAVVLLLLSLGLAGALLTVTRHGGTARAEPPHPSWRSRRTP